MKIVARSVLMLLALALGMFDPVNASVNAVNSGMVAEDSDADVNETEYDFFFQDDAALFSARRKAESILTLAQLLDRPSVALHVAGHHATSIAQHKLLSVSVSDLTPSFGDALTLENYCVGRVIVLDSNQEN